MRRHRVALASHAAQQPYTTLAALAALRFLLPLRCAAFYSDGALIVPVPYHIAAPSVRFFY
jgi:hypothetical protein